MAEKINLDDMTEDQAIAYLMSTLGIPRDQAIMILGFHTGEVQGDALDQDGEDPYRGFTISRSGESVPPKTTP